MEQWEGSRRFGKLQAGLSGEPAQAAARQPGDEGRWTRKRSMPLEDILRGTLFKKGLTAPMEVRQYFQAAGKMGQQVSKQDYLKRRRRQAKKKQYRYETRITENIAIGLYKEQCIRLILEQDNERKNELFIRLKEEMMKHLVPVRPSPSSPRRWQYFNKYKCNLKPSFYALSL